MAVEVEIQLQQAVEAVVSSHAPKRIVVAGPGTGKTWLFRRLLQSENQKPEHYLVLTFINNLKDDLERELGSCAQVYTFHSYCRRLLHRNSRLRAGLTDNFHYFPPLASLIKSDWELIKGEDAPHFVGLMRELSDGLETDFYLARANYYDAVSFDDSVFRVYKRFQESPEEIQQYELLLVDEYQDFNRLEAGFIRLLTTVSSAVVAGDDDQALYSQLRGSTPEFIRQAYSEGEYERFSLPFCMRCTEPIVTAVNDIISHAQQSGNLKGRIRKPYLFYPPKKQADSILYPKIKLVRTTVQSNALNYFGKYVVQEIERIPEEDIQESKEGHFLTVLIIGPAQYLRQIKNHLESAGYTCQGGDAGNPVEVRREDGLEILHDRPDSNLGWRIVLEADQPSFIADSIRLTAEGPLSLPQLIPQEYKEDVLAEAEQLLPAEEQGETQADDSQPSVRLASFEGSKGLSAQHVFIVGLQAGDLPRDANNVTDLEICKFLVALTRSRKQCHILHTQRWSGQVKRPSIFLQWIREARFDRIEVNRLYWQRTSSFYLWTTAT